MLGLSLSSRLSPPALPNSVLYLPKVVRHKGLTEETSTAFYLDALKERQQGRQKSYNWALNQNLIRRWGLDAGNQPRVSCLLGSWRHNSFSQQNSRRQTWLTFNLDQCYLPGFLIRNSVPPYPTCSRLPTSWSNWVNDAFSCCEQPCKRFLPIIPGRLPLPCHGWAVFHVGTVTRIQEAEWSAALGDLCTLLLSVLSSDSFWLLGRGCSLGESAKCSNQLGEPLFCVFLSCHLG